MYLACIDMYLSLLCPFCAYRSCGTIPHGVWVQKGCSYCRCGYGVMHCFPQVFHEDCGENALYDTLLDVLFFTLQNVTQKVSESFFIL